MPPTDPLRLAATNTTPCTICSAKPGQPCRNTWTGKPTTTHRTRIHAYLNRPTINP